MLKLITYYLETPSYLMRTMSGERPSVWPVIVSLLMLFVSGAWTMASFIPYGRPGALRPLMFYVVTASNVSFLVSLLFAMLLYLEIETRLGSKRAMALAFSVGIVALIVSVVLFSASFIMTPTPYYPD